jgi:hypothetical protein
MLILYCEVPDIGPGGVVSGGLKSKLTRKELPPPTPASSVKSTSPISRSVKLFRG